LARVITVANEFIRLTKPLNPGAAGLNAAQAIDRIVKTGGHRFEPSTLVVLCKLFQAEYPNTDKLSQTLDELMAQENSKDEI
jgi:hypothetical protein